MTDEADTTLRTVTVLGTTTVDGEAVTERQRALLAALALHRDTAMTTDQLIDAIWFEQVPRSARPSLQNQIARLRQRFGPGLITTDLAGYHLGAATDVATFTDAAADVLARRPDADDVARCEAALASWRGVPYVDLCDHPPVEADRARLVELHAQVAERLAECRLLAGSVGQAIVELTGLTQDDPFREPRWRLLMVALHRDGRRTEALAAYDRAVANARTLGVEPSAALTATRAMIELDRPDPVGYAPVPSVGDRSVCLLDRRRHRPTRSCVPSVATGFRGRPTG